MINVCLKYSRVLNCFILRKDNAEYLFVGAEIQALLLPHYHSYLRYCRKTFQKEKLVLPFCITKRAGSDTAEPIPLIWLQWGWNCLCQTWFVLLAQTEKATHQEVPWKWDKFTCKLRRVCCAGVTNVVLHSTVNMVMQVRESLGLGTCVLPAFAWLIWSEPKGQKVTK